MTDTEYRPRLSIELTPEQKGKLDVLLGHTHGLQKVVFGYIVDDLISMLEHENGKLLLGALIGRQMSTIDFLNIKQTADDFEGAIPETAIPTKK
jgi:hypothetical protein